MRLERVKELMLPMSIYRLVDEAFATRNTLIPQASDLIKMGELLYLLADDPYNIDDVSDYFLLDNPDGDLFFETALYLDIVVPYFWKKYDVSKLGLAWLQGIMDGRMIRETWDCQRPQAMIIVNSWIFVELLKIARTKVMFSDQDIDRVIASAVGAEPQRYDSEDALRGRQVIVSWIKWLDEQFGCFDISEDGYRPF